MLISNYIQWIFLGAILLISCSKSPFTGYEKLAEIDLFTDYLDRLTTVYVEESAHFEGIDLAVSLQNISGYGDEQSKEAKKGRNTLLLITFDTYCGFCIDELDFWNTWNTSQLSDSVGHDITDIKLIVVDHSLENVRNFLSRNRYTMSTFQDEMRLITQWVEQYQIPLKILIDEHLRVQDIRPMGDNENLNNYVRIFLE